MEKYKTLSIIYLISVIASPLANFMGIDVQNLYRIPFINIRLIDVAILYVALCFIRSMFVRSSIIPGNKFLIILCIVYLSFEAIQLLRTWGDTDAGWQISGILCTINFFILIDLAVFPLNEKQVIDFLKFFGFWGSITLTISNAYLFYSFISGHFVFQDLDRRVAIDVMGAKETVSTVTLLPFVYLSNLYFTNKNESFKVKAVHFLCMISIYISLIISFHRGNLATIVLLTIIYFVSFSNKASQAIKKMAGLIILILVGYMFFGNILKRKGFDPIDKLSELAEFAVDTKGPDWDNGRSVPLKYAMDAWKDHLWIGVGYNDLNHFGLPEGMGAVHNFIAASLFYRGIIGTAIYLIILILLYINCIKFWNVLRSEVSFQNDLFKILVFTSFFWLIPFWTQDVMWERYSLSIQLLYFGIITNLYRQNLSQLSYSDTTSDIIVSNI